MDERFAFVPLFPRFSSFSSRFSLIFLDVLPDFRHKMAGIISLELVKNVMSTMDADGTGQVDFGEFLTAAKDTPLLLDAFEQLLPSPHMLKKHVQELGEKSGNTFVHKRYFSRIDSDVHI